MTPRGRSLRRPREPGHGMTIGMTGRWPMGEVIRQMKGGRFVGYYVRFYDATGKRRMRASGEATYTGALRKLRELEGAEATIQRTGQLAKRPANPSPDLTVAELCADFFDGSHLHVKDPEAYRRAAAYSLRSILPLLGHIRLLDLKRKDVERARDILCKRLKANSVRACLRPVSAALTWAVREEMIPMSPMVGMRQPRRTQSTDRLSQDEAATLLKMAKESDGHLYIAVALGLRQGLRRGEIFGLRWSDIDLSRGRLTVAQQRGGKTPKSGKARTLPLSPEMLADLSAWRRQPGELVCPLSARKQRCVVDILERASGRHFDRPYHVLRHTFASLFIEAGGSIVALKELLGHSSLEMSLLYSHIAPAALAADMAKLKI